MFGSLFEEDGSPGGVDHVLRNGKTNENGKAAIPTKPPPSRSNTNMCGIQNQGATCYLNSLLQTLLLTPEFRDGLFNLSREELGWIDSSDVSASNRKLRVIPVELQKLFSQLLLADLNAVSTTELTDSFGWVENEELQQHDVQELNRILFSAIEKSLVGTSGMDLISRLYRGTVVNQVECLKCGRVSEREESFFDLTISVSGHNALEGSLKSTYLIPEKMNGSNRYFCSHCSELVDADKRTKLRRLPPILTLSLLRFSYNPTKGERFKDTSKFSFPLRLDLTPFCDSTDADDSVNGEDIPCSNVYKLFSVVVHKGNAHGGHYHAYVRDVSCLGHWNLSVQGETGNGGCVNGENEAVDQPKSVDTSVTKEAEDKELPVPATLLRDILHRGNCIAPSGTMSLVDLCSKLSELTCGSTWKETFQSEYGRLSHFLTLHPSLFYFDKVTRTVGLQPPGDKTLTPSRARGGGADGGGGYKGGVHRRKKRKKKRGGGWVSRKPRGGAGGGSDGGRRKAGMGGLANKWRDHVGNVAASEQEDGDEDEGCESDDGENYDGDCSVSDAEEMLPEGTHWFDFDDATVKPIPASALESQYSGRESAYMLFYRREELGSGRRKGPLMPEHLGRMVEEKNMLLRKEREVYDRAVHQVYVRVLPSGAYTVRNSALHKRISVASESVEELRVPVDERWTLGLLHEEIIKACEKEPGWNMNGKCLWPELYTCMDTPCGLHLLEPLKNFRGDPDVTLVKDVYVEDFRVFAWNGKQVGGTAYNAGMDNEPLMLKLVMPSINGISHEISCGFPKSWPLSRLRVVISEMCTMPPLGLYLSYEPPKEPTSPHKYHLRRGAVGNRSNSQKLVNGSTKTESGNGEEEFTLVKPMRLSLMLNDQSLASLSIASGGKILVNSKGLFSNSSSPSESTGIVVWVEDWTHIGAKSSPLKRSPKRMSNGSELEGKESNAIQWGVGGRVVRIDASSDTSGVRFVTHYSARGQTDPGYCLADGSYAGLLSSDLISYPPSLFGQTIAARPHNRLSKTGGPLQLPSQPLSQGLRAASMGAEGWSAMLRLKYFMDALSQSPALLYFLGQQFPYLINYEALLETVAQLKALAIKQLSLHPKKYRLRKMENEVVSGTHDSLCNGSVGLKCPLREELPLKEAKVESGSKIILEEGQAVEENQIWLTFSLPSGDGDTPREYEVIADKTCSVRDLLRKIVSVAQLTGEEWHIRKTRWNGDLGEPLDDPDSTVGEESLVHGDHLNLCSRSLPLRGFLRLNLYLCSRVKDLKNDSPSSDGVMHKQNGVLEHECSAINGRNGSKLIPLQFHQPPVLETASHKLQDLGCLEIDQESSLYQLKSTIMELCPAITSLGLSSPNQLRLRLLRKIDGSPKTLDNEPERMRLSRVLRNSWAHLHGGKTGRKLSESDVPSLTSLQLHSGCTVAVQVLSAEEELRPDDVVLELCHLSSTSDSPVSAELVWNSSVFNVEDNRQCNGVDMSKESINTNIVSGSYENGEVPNGQSSETPSFPCNSVPLSPPNPVSVQDENKLGLEDNENSELRPLMSFQSAVSSKLDLHQSNIILAKYISNKREWFVFHEAYQDGMQCSPGRPKKKSSNKSPSSVKTAQHCLSNLSDGDIVAVKDATCLKENEEPSDFQFFSHFLTKQTMERESGSGKKRRSVQNNGQENSCKTKEENWDETPKRSERGIHIRVVDYS